jgi:hypothetical protein
MTAFDQPAAGKLMAGYTAGQYLDIPSGFAVYPVLRRLDKVTQGTDIAGVCRGTAKIQGEIYRVLIARP